MEEKKLRGFLGGWELRQGNKVNKLQESIHDGKDHVYSLGLRQAGDKVLYHVGPGPSGCRSPCGCWLDKFPRERSGQAATKSRMSLLTPGHQKRR